MFNPMGSIEDIEFNPYKWLTHLDKLKKLAAEEDVFPITIELDLVSYCNHRCIWCVDHKHMKDQLDLHFVFKLLEELKTLGVQGIVFKGGGEPTLSSCFNKVMKKAKELLFEVGVITNGSRLKLLADDIVNYTNYVRVSIDGPTAISHSNVHGTDDFYEILDGILKLLQIRNDKKQRHPIVGLSFAMIYSISNLVGEAVNLGDRLGVDYILLRPPFFEEVGRKNMMSVEDKKALFSVFENVKRNYKGKVKILIDYWISDSEAKEFNLLPDSPRRGGQKYSVFNGIEHTSRCLASPLFGLITADRLVYPCCNLRFLAKWNIGRIDYEQDCTFEKIWNGNKRHCILNKIWNGECLRYCTHPLSKYNEIIHYLRTPMYHKGFI